MSEQTGKLKNKIKATLAELRELEEYVQGYLKEISFQVFVVKETQAAMIAHFDCSEAVMAIIKSRQAEVEAFKAQQEEKRLEFERRAQEIHKSLGSDGQVNAN